MWSTLYYSFFNCIIFVLWVAIILARPIFSLCVSWPLSSFLFPLFFFFFNQCSQTGVYVGCLLCICVLLIFDIFQSLVLQIPETAAVSLDFSGIATLTDIVFTTMANLRHAHTSRFDSIVEIVLDGCHLVTDAGITWMAEAFPNITLVRLITFCLMILFFPVY